MTGASVGYSMEDLNLLLGLRDHLGQHCEPTQFQNSRRTSNTDRVNGVTGLTAFSNATPDASLQPQPLIRASHPKKR